MRVVAVPRGVATPAELMVMERGGSKFGDCSTCR